MDPPPSSAHRLQLGLPGYLILFAPPAFALQRQKRTREPPSPPAFSQISTHSTATPGIPLSPPVLEPTGFRGDSSVEPRAFTPDLIGRLTRPLSPVIPNNVRSIRITAAAGTNLAGASSRGWSSRRVLTDVYSYPSTVLYNPKAFIAHTASLCQACAHCRRFSTAASRRSLGSVSVPMWPVTLSGRLRITALVSHYLTN